MVYENHAKGKVTDMKKVCALAFVLCLLLSCAQASVETADRLTPLSNKTLKTALNKKGYKGWSLYQPGPRETEINTSSNSFLKKLGLYPVVAMKEGETHLIVLQKKSGKWGIKLVNEKAVVRGGFKLYDFSMDENISRGDDTWDFFFDFADGEDRTYTLCLELSRKFPSYFRFLDMPGGDAGGGRISRTIVMEYLRDFCFELDLFGGAYRESIGVKPWRHHEFEAETFSLADMPLSILDLTKRAAVKAGSGGAGLYRRMAEEGAPIKRLPEGEAASVVRPEYGFEQWMIVCEGDETYFARSESFELDD